MDGCSDTDVVPKPPWRERKERYVAHIRDAPGSVRLVAAADKLHNARSILRDLRAEGSTVWQRFTGSRQDTLWYYRATVDAFRAAGGPRDIIDELDAVVEEIEHLAV